MVRLRDITPKGFYARSVMIVVLPLVILLIGMTWFFFDSHIAEFNRKLSQTIAGDVAEISETMAAITDEDEIKARADQYARNLRFRISFVEDGLPQPVTPPFWFRNRDAILDNELKNTLIGRDYWFDANAEDSQVDIRILVNNDTRTLRMLVDRKRTFATTGHIFIVWVVLFSLLLIVIVWGFLRNHVRSVLSLASAAEAWGRGEDVEAYRPSGATEVRQAANAMRRMRHRITAFVDQRTAMLAGVSHDLRTPLTRLKLQLAFLPPSEDRDAARKDIEEMEAMLDGYLAFAKGEEGEAHELVAMEDIVRDVAHARAHKADIQLVIDNASYARVRPLSIKRALSNLINNAADHGDMVRITLSQNDSHVLIRVDDDGPGIEQEQYDEAFKPFSRLDPSRNQNTSGVGLGLALARDIARNHGGGIALAKSDLGGLRATIRLPLHME